MSYIIITKILAMEKTMFILKVISLTFLLSVFANCQKNPTPKSFTIPIIKGLEFELTASLCPRDIQIIDSLIIIQAAGDSYFYHVYNKNNFKLIGRFAKSGRGPSEYIIPRMMFQKSKITDSTYLRIIDDNVNRLDIINILKASNKTNYYPRSVNFRGKKIREAFPIGAAVMSDDSLIVGTSINKENNGRFFCYDIYKDSLTWEPYYPVLKKTPHEKILNHLYQSEIALRPFGNDIAVASLYFKRIDILNKRGNFKRSIVFENQFKEPDFTNPNRVPPKGANLYFYTLSVTEDFIYVLDMENTTDIFESVLKKSRDTITLIKSKWEDNGGPPEIVRLTPRVLKISVDEENRKIYGVDGLSSSIFVYEMSSNE
jgi:hypothetical protein